MSDICTAMVQGTIPNFDSAIISGNLDNEEKAFCNIKLSVETSQQLEDGKYKRKIISVMAFRKTAITLSKCAKIGTGLILECDIMEPRPLTQNGQPVLDQAGKQVYSGLSLVVKPFGVHFQKNYASKDAAPTSTNNAKQTQTSDPLEEIFGANTNNTKQTKSKTETNAIDDFDGFDFM